MAEGDYIKDGELRVRVSQHDLDLFFENSQANAGKPYQVLIREFITTFNEGRLRIVPTDEQLNSLKSQGKLYDVD